jgi:curved DNA-binding protein CbpA
MDKILIDNKYYDPYFILSVTPDDSMKHISKAFKIKAKVLHPDRFKNKQSVNMEKVYKHFNILLLCYEHILNKHKNLHLEKETEFIEPLITKKNELDNSLDYGYGEVQRLQSLEDYDENIPSQTKILKGKFNKTQFNRIFEFNESQYENQDDKKENLSLIHKTTDGFFAFNSNDWGNCSLVKSFNGLMIIGDDLGQSGKGYSHSHLSDYKQSFSKAKNPDKPVKVPKEFKIKNDTQSIKPKTIKTVLSEREKINIPQISFANQEKEFLQKKKEQIKDKIKEDEEFVKKYSSSIFSQRLIEEAKSKKLKTSVYDLTEFDNF